MNTSKNKKSYVQEWRKPHHKGFEKEKLRSLPKGLPSPPGYSVFIMSTPTPRPRLSFKIIHLPLLLKRKHSLESWRHWHGTRYRRPTSLSARRPRWVGLLRVEHLGRKLARQWAPVALNSNLSRTEPLAPRHAVIVVARTNHVGQKEAQNCTDISQELHDRIRRLSPPVLGRIYLAYYLQNPCFGRDVIRPALKSQKLRSRHLNFIFRRQISLHESFLSSPTYLPAIAQASAESLFPSFNLFPRALI